jgi:hypothetical protein
MNKQIDIKSVVIGILITVCIVLAMGAGRSPMPAMFGRFQLAAADGQAYIIDTDTGRVWMRSSGRQEFCASKMQQGSAADNETK